MKLSTRILQQNKLSKFFPSCLARFDAFGRSKQGHCESHYLMLKNMLIYPCVNGAYHIMPMAQRSIDKLTKIIEDEMTLIGGIKMTLSAMSHQQLWEKSERWESCSTELINISMVDNTSSIILSPTHEEEITSLVGTLCGNGLSSTQLPIKVFQTTQKYRNELRPRYGLLRGREFLMKDLYTFHGNKSCAKETYEEVCVAYENILKKLSVDFVKARSSGGMIGGDYSHEFHMPAQIGEDKIAKNKETGELFNADMCDLSTHKYEITPAIEIAHTFMLGTQYSSIFNATVNISDFDSVPLEMGCYGMGVTRLFAACIEQKAKDEKIRYPYLIAPFKVCIIPPKVGSGVLQEIGDSICDEIYKALDDCEFLQNDVLIDDRNKQTIGWRFLLDDFSGYPVIIVLGKTVLEEIPKVEVWFTDKDTDQKPMVATVPDAISEIINNAKTYYT